MTIALIGRAAGLHPPLDDGPRLYGWARRPENASRARRFRYEIQQVWGRPWLAVVGQTDRPSLPLQEAIPAYEAVCAAEEVRP